MMLATIEKSVDALMPQVVRAIFSTDPMVRFMAAHAMGTAETRNASVIRALKRARRDSYAMVRAEASTSLAKLNR